MEHPPEKLNKIEETGVMETSKGVICSPWVRISNSIGASDGESRRTPIHEKKMGRTGEKALRFNESKTSC